MKKYTVKIIETRVQTMKVNAQTFEEAKEKVQEIYFDNPVEYDSCFDVYDTAFELEWEEDAEEETEDE